MDPIMSQFSPIATYDNSSVADFMPWDAGEPVSLPGVLDGSLPAAFENVDMCGLDDIEFPTLVDSSSRFDGLGRGLRDGLEGVLGDVQGWAVNESVLNGLQSRAANAFQEFGESDATYGAFRDLQWGRTFTSWTSSITDALGIVNELRTRESEVAELAANGDIRGAAAHTWGSAASIFATEAASMVSSTEKRLGLGDVVGRSVKESGLAEGLYQLGSMTSDLFFDYQLAAAVRLSDLSGRPLRPGVRETYEALLASR